MKINTIKSKKKERYESILNIKKKVILDDFVESN